MHSIETIDNNFSMEVPSHWDECTTEQVQFILEKGFAVMSGNLTIDNFRLEVFIKLTGLKFSFLDRIKQKLGLNSKVNENLFRLSQQICDWIFDKNKDGDFELNFETVTNFFPVLEGQYYGPDHLLADISLTEFKSALTLLNQYFDSKSNEVESESYLNYFIATLYRPKIQQGERVSLHGYVLEPDLFKKTPAWQKQIIAIWFSYCVKCLQEEDLEIYGMDINLSPLFPQSESKGNNQKVNLGWTGVIMDIAESGVFGNAESTGKTLLYDVLLYLLKKHQDKPKQK